MVYSKRDIAGVVILYNSDGDVIINISSYIEQVDKLFVIDNSELPQLRIQELLNSRFSNTQYETNNGNKGVAFALNRGATLAIKQGYRFLLTMDDDSIAPPGMISEMLSFIEKYDQSPIGLVSVNHSGKSWPLPFKLLLYTMTSGNLVSLEAYQHVGPFFDELFIDHIDHEYGLRLSAYGYKVIELTSLKMEHRLGEEKKVKLGLIKVKFVSHSAIRGYYMSRNGIHVAKEYGLIFPKFIYAVFIILLKELIKILLFEDGKLLRLRLFLKGVWDGFCSKLGIMKWK